MDGWFVWLNLVGKSTRHPWILWLKATFPPCSCGHFSPFHGKFKESSPGTQKPPSFSNGWVKVRWNPSISYVKKCFIIQLIAKPLASMDVDGSWGSRVNNPYGCWTKNRGILPPKWMVKIMENKPLWTNGWFGVKKKPIFGLTPILFSLFGSKLNPPPGAADYKSKIDAQIGRRKRHGAIHARWAPATFISRVLTPLIGVVTSVTHL